MTKTTFKLLLKSIYEFVPDSTVVSIAVYWTIKGKAVENALNKDTTVFKPVPLSQIKATGYYNDFLIRYIVPAPNGTLNIGLVGYENEEKVR